MFILKPFPLIKWCCPLNTEVLHIHRVTFMKYWSEYIYYLCIIKKTIFWTNEFKHIPSFSYFRIRLSGLTLRYLIHLQLSLYRVIHIYVLYMYLYLHNLMMMLSLYSIDFWITCQKRGSHSCMNLCLDLQFISIDQRVLFYTKCHDVFITIAL